MGMHPSPQGEYPPLGWGFHAREDALATAAAVEASGYTGVFPGRPDQVQRARHEVARYLDRHPGTGDAILIVSELCANAVLHSASRGEFYTVRCETFPTYVWLEVEDLGGHWTLKPPDESRPHGLDVVEALAGPDNWGVDGGEGGRVIWARLELDGQR